MPLQPLASGQPLPIIWTVLNHHKSVISLATNRIMDSGSLLTA